MNLAFVSTQKTWGGGENVLAQLVLGLRRRGERVALAAAAGSPMAAWAAREAVPVVDLPGRGRTPAGMWRLRQWVADGGFDAVLLNDPHAITYGGLALAGLAAPRVGVKHTSFPVRSAWKHNRLLDRLVAVCHKAEEECVTAGVDRGRVEVIHNGVEPIAPDPAEVEAARALFAEGDGPSVLAVGSLLPVKGFDTLIRAAAQRRTPWSLWIAGEGPERERLEAIIAEHGAADRVRLLGFRTDVDALLAAADAFALASHMEGLPLVVLEAMLAGKPIALTAVGGIPELLSMAERQGHAGCFPTFQPNDPAGAAAAIEGALAIEPSTLQSMSDWAGERFAIDRVAADYAAMFERLTSPRVSRVAA